MGNTNGLTTSGVDYQHHLWEAYTVERRRAWHAIIALGQHTRSNDVRRDMPSSPLDSTHDRMTLGMACHHHLWAAQTVGWRRPWHAIVALGRQTRSNDVGRGLSSSPLGSTHGRHRRARHAIIAFGQHKWSNDIGRGMPSSPLGSIHGRTTLGVACHNRLKAAHTVERRRAWHDITAFGQDTRSNDAGRDMKSPPYDSTR